MLHSYNCSWKTLKMTEEGATWKPYQIHYPEFKIGQGRFYQKRPVEFALYNGTGKSILEIDNIKLADEQENNLIRNGDFSNGSEFWFFTVDRHLPWHIKNLWVSQLFETGAAGLLGFCLMVVFTLITLLQRIARKDLFSLILLGSFFGFFTVGLVDSLFDSPRISFLFYFLSFISLIYAGNSERSRFNPVSL